MKSVSTRSWPMLLLTKHTYFPLSITNALRKTSVPPMRKILWLVTIPMVRPDSCLYHLCVGTGKASAAHGKKAVSPSCTFTSSSLCVILGGTVL